MSNIITSSSVPLHLVETEDPQTVLKQTSGDRHLEGRCLKTLWDHYPGATWRVSVNGKRGTVDVFCLNFSSRWGVRWKLGRIYGDPDLYWIKMAGGELMERAKVARGRFNEDTVEVGHIDGIRPQDQPIHGISI